MASLYEILSDAQQGEAIAELGREFGLTPEQTQAAVESLLPAISARTDSKSFFAVLTNHDECNRWRTALRRQNPVR